MTVRTTTVAVTPQSPNVLKLRIIARSVRGIVRRVYDTTATNLGALQRHTTL